MTGSAGTAMDVVLVVRKRNYKGGSSREGGQNVLTDGRAGGFLFSVSDFFSTLVLEPFWRRFWVDFSSFFRLEITGNQLQKSCVFF